MPIDLYVGNLRYDVTDRELQELCAPYGKVESAAIVHDPQTGESQGYGFVRMASDSEGEATIAGLNGREHGGRVLKVSERASSSCP
ncbi:MAG: rpbB [Phycisphaerales bacterium]|jgi:RNA recognition motif-containing protein|nr:rpbB [Phycisphaerales bacterium]